MEQKRDDSLASGKISSLLVKFAVPSIIAMVVGSVYNIIDQLFIGHSVGELGNAATTVAFPLTISCVALGLLFGIGGASNFNLSMGRRETEKAGYYIGNSAVMLLLSGTVLMLITLFFLDPLLHFFGSPADVLDYARSYVGITAFGFPMLILTTGGGHLIRADGSPQMTMICSITGAVINIGLDYLFVFVMDKGVAGAAFATIIGQFVSGLMVIWYLMHYKTMRLGREHLIPRWPVVSRVMMLGAANSFNQVAMMVIQIVLNNSLRKYGAQSVYGEVIPVACAGIVMKVCQLFFSVVIGISQGTQPIESFNYGAGNYNRVKKAYMLAMGAGAALSVVSFAVFQVFPVQILALFGKGGELYVEFGVRYFRIYMFCTIVNFVQPISSNLFTSIGKPYKGIFLALTRQILFLLPLLVILPCFMGIDGILYSCPIADMVAFITAIVMVVAEFKKMDRLEGVRER